MAPRCKNFDEELIGNRLPGERPGPDIGDAYALAGGALVTPLRSATTGAVSKLVKDKPRKMAQLFRKYGLDPTPGVVSDGRLVQFLEQKLKELPISGSVTNRRINEMYNDLALAVDHLSDDVTVHYGTSAAQAGSAIASEAAKSSAAFSERTAALHRLVNMLIPADSVVNATHTTKFMKEYAGKFPDEWASTRDVFGKELVEKLEKSIAGRTEIPWQVVENVRDQVGKILGSRGTDALPHGTAKGLYKALLKDMGATAADTSDEAAKAWTSARRYHSRHIDYVRDHLGKIAAAADRNVEKIFTDLEAGRLSDVVKIRQGMDPETWGGVRDVILQRMGIASPAMRRIGDEVFSPETFVRRYNQLRKNSPEVIDFIFGGYTKNIKDTTPQAE